MAKPIEEIRIAFDLALSEKRKYPFTEFRAFAQSVRKYIELTPMIR